MFIHFLSSELGEHMTSSYGDLEERDGAIILHTRNSIYTFEVQNDNDETIE